MITKLTGNQTSSNCNFMRKFVMIRQVIVVIRRSLHFDFMPLPSNLGSDYLLTLKFSHIRLRYYRESYVIG